MEQINKEDAKSIGWLDDIELLSVSFNDAEDVVVISDESSDDDKELGFSMPDHRQILLNNEEDLI